MTGPHPQIRLLNCENNGKAEHPAMQEYNLILVHAQLHDLNIDLMFYKFKLEDMI